MEIYWVSCKIDTRNTRHMFKKIKEGKIELVSDCVIYGHRKSRFLMSNHTKPVHCLIFGIKCTVLKNLFY